MATVPLTPGPFQISSYTNVRVNGRALPTSDGGSPILQWQLAWGTQPTTADFVGDLNLDGTGFVTGLTPGTTYHFWNRTRNALGWSPLSARTTVTMKDVPETPKSPTFLNKTQDSITAVVVPNYNGGSPITGYKLGYAKRVGLPPPVPTDILTHGTQASFHLFDLDPAQTYRFWGKVINLYGESEWSAPIYSTLVAGAWVKQGATWKRAVPYVRVGGVWVMARPWVRSVGVWKEVSD